MEISALQDKVQNVQKLVPNNVSHYNEVQDSPATPFAKMVFDSVNKVNAAQNNAEDLQQAVVLDPENVNMHDVVIATEKARLSVSFMQTIVERAVKAYNEILMIR